MAKAHGPRIKAARGYAGGISTAELAKRVGVSESTVKRWERGDPSLTVGYRLAIASVCHVPPEFMENGWGILEPSEIQALLAKQTKILAEIQTAIDEQKKLREETDGLLPAIQELVRPAGSASRPRAPRPSASSEK